MTRLLGRLPPSNGLDGRSDEFLAAPARLRVVVALVDVARITEDVDEETRTPYLRVRDVEVLALGPDEKAGVELLFDAREKRTGQGRLEAPAPAGVDPATGEILG